MSDLPQIKGFCKDCRYAQSINHADGIHQDALHCEEWRGEEAKNVWVKYKKEYRDFSLVFPREYCSSFQPKR